ncbi:hypothetical protein FISHEDRAFT_72770 [Fistulina hepatica ATCC 64428]|nr:hypothetical protein FISHEDRAFT_72770 [Fistulina hepatica ATCC 64428]
MNFRASLLHVTAASVLLYGAIALANLEAGKFVETQYGQHFQFLTVHGASAKLSVVTASLYWTLMAVAPRILLRMQEASLSGGRTDFDVAAESGNTSHLTTDDNVDESVKLHYIPLPIDLSLHAFPALFLACDFFVFEKRYSPRVAKYGAVITVVVCALAYSTWAEHCAEKNHGMCEFLRGTVLSALLSQFHRSDVSMAPIFPVAYPFLTDNPFEVRVAIYIGASLVALLSFWSLNALHGRWHA